jgi:hypothetical protein
MTINMNDRQINSISQRRALRKRYVRSVFSRKYSGVDVILLAETDSLHETSNGKASKRILKREFEIYGKEKFKRLSKISSSHIYNLRNTVVYKRANTVHADNGSEYINQYVSFVNGLDMNF